MGRGLRPDVGNKLPPCRHMTADTVTWKSTCLSDVAPSTLLDAVVGLMHERDTWACTASELRATLNGTCGELPVDVTRLSKALNKLSLQLASKGFVVDHTKTAKRRIIRCPKTLSFMTLVAVNILDTSL